MRREMKTEKIINCWKKTQIIEEDIDWWCKFYASTGDRKKCGSYLMKGYEKLTVRFLNDIWKKQIN